MRDYLIAFANVLLLAMVLFLGLFGGMLVTEGISHSEELVLEQPTAGGTCSGGSCTLIRR